MPDGKKIDPFKPAQPTIPGVSPADREAESAAPEAPQQSYTSEPSSAGAPVPWRTVATIVAIITIGGLVYWARGSSSKPRQVPPEAAAPPPPAALEAPKSSQKLPIGPGPVAATSELTKAWSAKRFLFRDPLTTDPVPAMVVRLPGGAYWGLSLREPFGNCELEYVTDLQKLQTSYDFHASHPMVVDPCTDPSAALIVVEPGLCAVVRPLLGAELLTCAMVPSFDVQVTVFVKFLVVPLE